MNIFAGFFLAVWFPDVAFEVGPSPKIADKTQVSLAHCHFLPPPQQGLHRTNEAPLYAEKLQHAKGGQSAMFANGQF